MLQQVDIIPLLLTACPSFREPWAAIQADPAFDPDLLYPHLGDFARHLMALIGRGETTELPGVFRAVERLHVEGDPGARDAAVLGFLETLQNNAEHVGLDPRVFGPYLGPESRASFEALDTFWFGPEGRPALG